MKEDEIRNRDALTRYMEILYDDTLTLFNHDTFEETNCPACNHKEENTEFEKMGFKYALCGKCKTLYVNPRPTQQTLDYFYSKSASTDFWVKEFFMPVAEVRREKIFKPRAEFVAQQFPDMDKAEIGDIGAGFGLFLDELRKIWPDAHYIAIEPSDDMADICRKKNLDVISEMVEDVDTGQNGGFDILTAFELFEHLCNPGKFVKKVHELLKPGGYLVLTTLCSTGFDIQLLWEKSKSISPPQHLNFFTIDSLSLLLKSKGFAIVNAGTPGQLDWDIVEGMITREDVNLGRFWDTVVSADDKAKSELQQWIVNNKLSSHMRIIAQRL